MKLETKENGHRVNGISLMGENFEITFQEWWNHYQFTPIEWTLERDAGYFTTTFTLLGLQVLISVVINKEAVAKFKAELEQSADEMKNGDYYYFVHNKNKLLKEFADYLEEHEELRFWQALVAWTGKDITVGGEDPFYWTVDKPHDKK
jgi:hypothetical protein